MPLMKHPHAEVRKLGVELTAKIALKGNDRVITAVCTSFADESPTVRSQVVPSVLEVAGKGSKQAVAAFCIFLEHPNPDIRAEAAAALGAVTNKDEATVTAVSKYQKHDSAEVRRSVLDAIQQVAPKGSKQAISATVAGLQDDDEGVRERALRTLLLVAETDDVHAINEVKV